METFKKEMKEKNKVTKQFEKVYREHTDPIEIQKKLNAQKRETIKEEKLSLFGIYERHNKQRF